MCTGPAIDSTVDGSSATTTGLGNILGIAVDLNGNIYLSDHDHNKIKKINTAGIITNYAGTGATTCCVADGSPATNATFGSLNCICVDNAGNLYVPDAQQNCVRKIDASGNIYTIAGSPGVPGTSGDGGPATAAKLDCPYGVALDQAGNLYISDQIACTIRKVNTSGIITTVAGTGTLGYSGDGGAATAAQIYDPMDLTIDINNNIYINDYGNSRIRKIDQYGIITTIAGNGDPHTYSGDGIPATATGMNPLGLVVNYAGDVAIGDNNANEVRQVNHITNIISDFAGTGFLMTMGDGGPATAAGFYYCRELAMDALQNVYIFDMGDRRLRKMYNIPNYTSDSLSVYISNVCTPQFELIANHYNPAQHIITYFGDGLSLDTVTTVACARGVAFVLPNYTFSGTYTVKHVLYNGTMAVDSISYSYNYMRCEALTTYFYDDIHDSCMMSSTTPVNIFPLTIEVDSNGTPFDTVSATGGLYYNAYGNTGEQYSFKVIDHLPQLSVSCPTSATISDTLFSGADRVKNIGLRCSSSTGFDLSVHKSSHSGRHIQSTTILVSDASCTTVPTTLNMIYSPQYTSFISASPTPATIAGNILTWDLGPMDYLASQIIYVYVGITGGSTAWLTPGDTVMTECRVSPTVGDSDTTNNVVVTVDTVLSSWDPNEMTVEPSGLIPPGELLQYTVQFQNTGNDTAHNVAVLDTLSDNLVASSLKMVATSGAMNISKLYDATYHNIYRFEFPNINLPDSGHHNQSIGTFVYTINAKAGLATGTMIHNHAGIFFDDNGVVMTDTTTNTIGYPETVKTVVVSSQILVYPNPAGSSITVQAPGFDHMIMCDLMGQQVIQKTLTGTNTTIDISLLPSGVYYATFTSVKGSEVKKVVKL